MKFAAKMSRPWLASPQGLCCLGLVLLISGCKRKPEDRIDLEWSGGQRMSFVPQAAFAEYYELPGQPDQLRITLASYKASCHEFRKPEAGQTLVTLQLSAPAGTPIAPGFYFAETPQPPPVASALPAPAGSAALPGAGAVPGAAAGPALPAGPAAPGASPPAPGSAAGAQAPSPEAAASAAAPSGSASAPGAAQPNGLRSFAHVRLADDAKVLPLQGGVELLAFDPAFGGKVEGNLKFLPAPGEGAARLSLIGSFHVRTCRAVLDTSRTPSPRENEKPEKH